MTGHPAREKDEESGDLRCENHAHGNGWAVCEDEVGMHGGVLGRQSLLIGVLPKKHEETVQ